MTTVKPTDLVEIDGIQFRVKRRRNSSGCSLIIISPNVELKKNGEVIVTKKCVDFG
jgi:hypothetical protein